MVAAVLKPKHWDEQYERGFVEWDTRRPATELQRIVAQQAIEPCRALDVGCGTGANALWSNPTNWGGIAPAINGDSLTFTGTLGLNNTNDYAVLTNTGVAFSASGFNLYGNPFFQGGGLTNTTGTNVINNDIFLTANRAAVIAGQLTLNGTVGGAFGFTKSGAGELVLAGPNTNTGVLTIATDGGVVRVEVEAIDNIGVGYGVLGKVYKGSTGEYVRRKVNGEVWLPVRARFSARGRALVRKFDFDQLTEWSDYKKFVVKTEEARR